MVLNQAISFLYNAQSTGISAERENIKGPLLLNTLVNYKYADKLNKIKTMTVTVSKEDVDRSKIYCERDVFIPGFSFRGVITGMNDINDTLLAITMSERGWHFTRRIYKIVDSLKEYNLINGSPGTFADDIQAVLDSANGDMPFDWTLGEGAVTTIDNLISRWLLDSDAIDSKGSNDGTVSGTTPTYNATNTKYGIKGLIFNGIDTKVNCGSDASLDNIFAAGGGTYTTVVSIASDGEGSVGIIAGKANWFLDTRNESGGFVKLRFTHTTSGTNGKWETAVNIPINTVITIGIAYDKSDVANNPIIFINGEERSVPNGLLTETTVPGDVGTDDSAADLIIGNNTGGTATFDGIILDSRAYSDELTLSEHRIMHNAVQSYLDKWRTDEVPATAVYDFDVKWKSYYDVFVQLAKKTGNEIWFEGLNVVKFGTKGKSITLDRDDKIYEKLSTKIDLDTYGNIVNVVGAEVGGTNVHAQATTSEMNTVYNYERVVSNNDLKDQAAVDELAPVTLKDFDSIIPDVKIDIEEELVHKYSMESGDVIKIVSNSETQTVKGFYRVISVDVTSSKSAIKLQYSETGKFIPRISDNLDILESILIKIHDLELNS